MESTLETSEIIGHATFHLASFLKGSDSRLISKRMRGYYSQSKNHILNILPWTSVSIIILTQSVILV